MLQWHKHCACYLAVLSWRKTMLGLMAQHQCATLISGEPLFFLFSSNASPWHLPEPTHTCMHMGPHVYGCACPEFWDSSAKVPGTPQAENWLHLEQQNMVGLGGAGNGGTRIGWRSVSPLCSSGSPEVTTSCALRGFQRTWHFPSTCHCHWCCFSIFPIPLFLSQEHFPILPFFFVLLILYFSSPLCRPK